MAIRHCTPREVADLFNLLSPDSRATALSLMAVTAKDVWQVVTQLPPLERMRYVQLWSEGLRRQVLPQLIRVAVEAARQHPNVSEEAELARLIEEEDGRRTEELMKRSHELEAVKLKKQRDRPRAARNVALRAEALRLKESGMTWRQLAEKLWKDHPEWFPRDPRPETLEGKRGQWADLLSRLMERIRDLC
jgi:hypothetical protein